MTLANVPTDTFVYCWTDHDLAKVYVGVHKGTPNDGYICSSKYMKAAYKLRPQSFSRQILAWGTRKDCHAFETKLILAMFVQKVDCYNLNAAGMVNHTPEIRAKISATHKGKVISESHKAAIREWNATHRKPASEATREKISASKRGIPRGPLSPEWRAKIAVAGTGRVKTLSERAAITQRQLGKKRGPHTAETKEKIRLANTGFKHSPETIEKLKVGKANQSIETRAKNSAANKARWEKIKRAKNDT